MRKTRNALLLSLVLLSFSGCYGPQRVTLRPVVTMAETNIGGGSEVAVKVVDARGDKSLGHRGSELMRGAEITTDQDVPSLIYDAVARGLRKKGFALVAYAENSPRTLKVEIGLIKYQMSSGDWTVGVHTRTALKAEATNKGETYKNFYRVENDQRAGLPPSAKTNDRLINQAVSQVLQKLFDDQELITFLAN